MTLTRFVSLLLGCLSVFSADLAVAESAEWWSDGWEARVPIVVEAREGLLPKQPVVLRWGEIAERLGDPKARLCSLRLVAHGELVPFQVDHRDAKGDFLAPGNLTLDRQDEVVFVAPSGRQTELCLYVSQRPKPLISFPSGVEVETPRRQRFHRKLTTADLSIGVQGTGGLDLSANTQANSGRGTVVAISWRGCGLNWQGQHWGAVMNGHPFPTDEENRWRTVKLLVDGPVRKVVAVSCSNSTRKAADGSVAWQADVTRYFSMFAGVPLYDVEDVAHCSAVQENWTGTYIDRFHPGSRPDENDVLWDGSSGSVREFPLADKNISVEHTGGLVNTEDVLDRWYAWFDEKERMGLAVFYGPAQEDVLPAETRFRAGWEWWSMANWMSFAYKGLKAPTTLGHRFRVMGLGDVSAEQVAEEYRLWEDPQAGSVTIGQIERR